MLLTFFFVGEKKVVSASAAAFSGSFEVHPGNPTCSSTPAATGTFSNIAGGNCLPFSPSVGGVTTYYVSVSTVKSTRCCVVSANDTRQTVSSSLITGCPCGGPCVAGTGCTCIGGSVSFQNLPNGNVCSTYLIGSSPSGVYFRATWSDSISGTE